MTNEFVRDDRLAELGKALVQVRESTGLSNKEMAARTTLTPARISRAEGGKARIRPDEVVIWAQVAELDEAETNRLLALLAEYDAWRADLDVRIKYGIAGNEIEYTGTFRATEKISTFATVELPGYLQTPEYARQAIAVVAPDSPEDEQHEAANARQDRAAYLGKGKTFNIVLAESALRWQMARPDTMRSQLGQLYDLIDKEDDGIKFGILPMKARVVVPAWHDFTVHDDQFAVVHMFGGTVTFRQQEPERYLGIMRALDELVARGDAARDLLADAQAAIPRR